MLWRLKVMACRYNRTEMFSLKMGLFLKTQRHQNELQFTDPNNKVIKDANRFGPKVSIVFPLLDPDLPFEKAVEEHQSKIAGTFEKPVSISNLSNISQNRENSNFMDGLCSDFPFVLPFVPTTQVL